MAQSGRRRTIYSQDYELMLVMLRQAREKAEITQVELQKRLNMTQSAISKCERGQRRIDIVQLRDWCHALDISFAVFVAEFDRAAH